MDDLSTRDWFAGQAMKPTPGSQLALFASYSYHGFITDRDGETLELEADHRRHAEIEMRYATSSTAWG